MRGNHPHTAILGLYDLGAFIDPREEWHEMFENTWRLERDLFVIANMNGNNWQALHDAYARLLPVLGTRDDLIADMPPARQAITQRSSCIL